MKIICNYVIEDAIKDAVEKLSRQVTHKNIEIVLSSLLLGVSGNILLRNSNSLSTTLSMVVFNIILLRLIEVILRVVSLRMSIQNMKLYNNSEQQNEIPIIRDADFLKCNDSNLLYAMYKLDYDIKMGEADDNKIYAKNKSDNKYNAILIDNYKLVDDSEDYIEIKTDMIVLHKKHE